jgi:Zn-dependent peptidase ImmA (M78 family)
MHPDVDSIARIHGAPRTDREHRVEHQANVFAVELMVPLSIVAPLCTAPSPRLADVLRLARQFEVSFTVAAARWAEVSPHPCAFVEIHGDRIKRAKRSASFRGVAVGGRIVDETWGRAKTGIAVAHESIDLPGTNKRLAWLSHA